jgi:hypothetical protein
MRPSGDVNVVSDGSLLFGKLGGKMLFPSHDMGPRVLYPFAIGAAD